MNWNDTLLFATTEILSREGELLNNISFINRHEVVKHLIEERIKNRFSHLESPLDEISNPTVFKEAAICLNISIILRENSYRRDDIFSIRSEFYQRRFEEEMERAFSILKINDENLGVELVR